MSGFSLPLREMPGPALVRGCARDRKTKARARGKVKAPAGPMFGLRLGLQEGLGLWAGLQLRLGSRPGLSFRSACVESAGVGGKFVPRAVWAERLRGPSACPRGWSPGPLVPHLIPKAQRCPGGALPGRAGLLCASTMPG